MALAFRADVPVGVEILLPDDLAAIVALDPQALGADALLRRGLDLVIFALEPGHRSVSRFSFLVSRGTSNQKRETCSILDSALRQHTLFEGVLHLLHLGHGVGDLDNRRMRVASRQYYMHLLWFAL